MNPASGMVSSSRPGSNSAELTDTEDANPGTSAQLRSSPQESPEETPHETVSPDTMQNAGISVGQNDGAILNEVRVSLHRISDGVKELATTFEDLLGLSDAESNESDDYDYDSDGGRHLSWAKLKSRARRRRRLRRQRKNAWGGNQPPSAKDDVESNDDGLKKGPQIIPQIKECDFKQFQSLTAVDGERLHCIDILIAGHSLDKDIEKFEEIVSKINSGRIVSWEPDQTEESTSEGNDEKWIRRIRINSRAVAELLRQICPQIKGFRNRPVVFHRPFQLLVSLHEKVKEELAKMKGLASGNFNDLSPKDSGNPVDLSIAKTLEQETPILRGNKDSLDELTCFVDFMESRIMPDYRRYRDPSSKPPRTIRWEDMWYLFKPGDLVYCPQDFSQRFLRVIHTNLTPTSPNIPALGMAERNWSFLCHFIEYDGASYAPVHVCFPPILPFQGEKKVTELPLYPTSYLEDDLILGRAQSDGSTYVNLIERRSGFYSGWTQTRDFAGRPLPGYFPDDRDVIPEHVESDILVDFQETFNALPHWKPVFYLTVVGNHKPDDYGFLPEQSDQPILESDEIGRTMQGHFDQDLSSDDTEIIEAVKFLADDPFGQFKAETRTAPTGKFLALLSRRFFAYAVLARKFVQLDTRFVRSAELESSGKAFEKLEINRDYKRLISSLVKSHFEKMDIERKTNVEIDTQDLIRGKGNGLLILLHGAPGVGKTLTAEAVALKWKKPLFPITSGDLGFTAEELEKSLNQIFRIAQHWGCIVLLDEADIFITQRDRGDLRRNALVSGTCRISTLKLV